MKSPMFTFKLVIDLPALERYIDFLEKPRQQEIDELTARLRASTAGLRASVIEEEQN